MLPLTLFFIYRHDYCFGSGKNCLFSERFFLILRQLGKLLKTTYRSAFRRIPLKNVSIRPLTYHKTRWSTF